ncbi:MAG: hypothetical protein RR454_03600 [Clostridia bacterium]
MSILDDITSFFKKKDVKPKADSLEREKLLEDELKKLDDEYQNSLDFETPDYENIIPKSFNAEYLNYTNYKDDDVINSEAQNKINQEKANKLAEYDNKFNENKQEILSKSDKIKKNNSDKLLQIEQLFNKKKEDLTNKLAKNGIFNSSIRVNSDKELNAQKDFGKETLQKELEYNIRDIDEKVNLLDKEKENAINKLDLELASKLEEDITKLKKQRNEEVKQVDMYNQKLYKTQLQNAEAREDKINALKSEFSKKFDDQKINEGRYGYSGEKEVNYNKRFEKALDFYYGLPKDEAVAMLKSNPKIKNYLGRNYQKLVFFINNRD